MAIDNNNEVKMPKEILPEDVELEAQDLNPSEDVDIQMLEDGGAIVDFDPRQSLRTVDAHIIGVIVDFFA